MIFLDRKLCILLNLQPFHVATFLSDNKVLIVIGGDKYYRDEDEKNAVCHLALGEKEGVFPVW